MPKRKRTLTIASTSLVVIAAIIGVIMWHHDTVFSPKNDPPQANVTPSEQNNQSTKPVETPAPAFNKNLFSLTEPASTWMIVNKKRPLPSTYTPSDLIAAGGGQTMRREATESLQRLLADAQKTGVPLKSLSGYRSYTTQDRVYNSYVAKDSQAAADTYSARPGHSEHQTGLAMDVGNTNGQCDLDTCFGATKGGQWIAQNAHKYGFTIRYLQGKTSVTGYQYEPWHLRYVGNDLAQELYKNKQTMEEFFGLPAAPNY